MARSSSIRAGTDPAKATDRIFIVSEWFHDYPDRAFESALVFNGKAWPHNERITLQQGDSVRWRFINLAAIEHPLHLHGFYYRVTRRGGLRGDSAVPAAGAVPPEHADAADRRRR